jgi:XTP/dITP diphosphohydrolase
MIDLWIGTTNKGKMEEFNLFFQRHLPEMKIHSLSEVKSYVQPPENGKTFLENARIKAKSLMAMKPNCWVMAEDSGLEVDILGGLPGIHTARYAGPKASDSENMAKLLKMILLKQASSVNSGANMSASTNTENAPNRSAQFRCTMVVYDPSGKEYVFEGSLKGIIGKNPIGNLGFGYDPLFIPEGETLSLAQIGPAFKNKNSHRAKAALEFVKLILQEDKNG